MLSIKFIRESADLIKKNLERRNQEEKKEWIDKILANDVRWRNLKQKADKLRNKRNTLTGEIKELKKQGKEVGPRIKLAREIPSKIQSIESQKWKN